MKARKFPLVQWPLMAIILLTVNLTADTTASGEASDNQTRLAADTKELAPQSGVSATTAGPNALVHGPWPGENNNSSVSWSETTTGELYSVYTEFTAPGFVPSVTGTAWSSTGGATWTKLAPPLSVFGSEWNPSITSSPAGGFYMATTGWAGPPYASANGIVLHMTPGAGATFGPSVGPLMANVPWPSVAATWHDYPYITLDDLPGPPSPGFGTAYIAWVQYHEGGDADADGDGNPFNDPADAFDIMFSFTNTMPGPFPFPFPAFAPPVAINSPVLPVSPTQPQEHRPALAVVGLAGTPMIPPGGVYVAWSDGLNIWVDASATPFSGGGFGILPPGPAIPMGGAIPPVIPNGLPTMASGAVSIVVDNSNAGGCPGNVYVCWADMSLGDGDIFFSSSTDGGASWGTPVRVNCDPPGTNAFQWAPKMVQDNATGNLYIVYYDQRRAPMVGAEVWVSESPNCGLTWRDALVSDAGPVPSNSTIIGPPGPVSAFNIGDYLGADIRSASPAPMGITFNDGRNGADQDVFFETNMDLDKDCDGSPASVDCDDNDPTIYPGATEICDGKDNNCDFVVDEGFDVDGDGWTTCSIPPDCDDNDPNINPGMPEICDGIDNDCSGNADGHDNDGDGFTNICGDCNENDPSIFPGASEICDGIDNNCNGTVDEGLIDNDLDGFCSGIDCNDNDPAIYPGATEVCDGKDNDCNTFIDDGFPDNDQDGVNSCTDCNDNDGAIYPGNTEICNDGKDNDCNGLTDGADPACATGCCVTPGDFDHDGAFNIADVTAGIARIFGGGPAPFCNDEADADGNNTFNIADVTYGIARIFGGGPAPICGTTGT